MQPGKKQFERAVATLREGGIVAYPTETFYGLAVDPDNARAVKLLYSHKRRDPAKPLSLIIANRTSLARYVRFIPSSYEVLMDHFWPGPLTLIFPAKHDTSPRLTGDGRTLGIRISSNPAATHLCTMFNAGITATSANLSGQKPCVSAEEVRTELGSLCDYILDGGTVKGGPSSTMVEERDKRMTVVREGAVSASSLAAVLTKKILFSL